MVVYRVQVKDARKLLYAILAKYGSIKQLSIDSRMSESTLHRILKSGRLSYYAASRLGTMLDTNFSDLFEIITIKEDGNE